MAIQYSQLNIWRREAEAKHLDWPAGSWLQFDTDHVRVPTQMRRANWPVPRSMQGRSAQTQTESPSYWSHDDKGI